MSAAGVFTLMPRVTFVEKSAGDVGDGTAYPLLATLDQIAEIWFRVREAHFTGGSIEAALDDPLAMPTLVVVITAATTAPTTFCEQDSGSSDENRRGYTTPETDGAATISAHNANFLDSLYDAGAGNYYSDILDREQGMWLVGETNVTLPYWNLGTLATTNAFSYNCVNAVVGTGNTNYFYSTSEFTGGVPPTPPVFEQTYASVIFNGEIAVLKADPANGMLDPANSFYIGLEFQCNNTAFTPITVSTNLASISGSPVSPCNYSIVLSSGTISCPVYGDFGTWFSATGVDFVQEAQEWWPYAKAGGAIWDTATGAKL